MTRAFLTIASDEALSSDTRLSAVQILADAAGDTGMLAGQIMDLSAERNTPSKETLIKLQEHKTGALIRASCLLGAAAAGIRPNDDDPRLKSLLTYADNVGLAFQIIDDILDRTGKESLLGKRIGSDEEQGKTTFLSFMSVENAEQYAEKLTERALEEIAAFDKDEVLTALARYLLLRKH